MFAAIILTFVPLAHSDENAGGKVITTQSAYDYQQTRERLLKAISGNGLVFLGSLTMQKRPMMSALLCRQPPFWYLVIPKLEHL